MTLTEITDDLLRQTPAWYRKPIEGDYRYEAAITRTSCDRLSWGSRCLS